MNTVRVGDTVLVPSLDAGRRCLRCGVPVHGTAERQPHLCADVAARLREWMNRESQVQWSAWARELTVLGGEG